MQPLKFVTTGAARILDHTSHGQRIVGSELRIKPRSCGDQFSHAVEIAKVRHRLPREHRIVGKTPLLSALYLSVPVGTFDERHHQPTVKRLRNLSWRVDPGAGPFMIGLYSKSEAVPSAKRRIAYHRGNDINRQFQPVGLLGMDGEIEFVLFSELRKFK